MPDEPDPEPDTDDETVVAPGGPRPRSTLVKVEPGEIVRRNPDGSYAVIPRTGD